jgi:Zn finger protein HypA/HybF involved in hydrogenase expression
MEGVIWLFLALTFAMVALGGVLAGLRRRSSGVKKASRCPHCETPMSLRRISAFQSLTLRGKWLCPHCGARMSKVRGRAGVAT